LCYLPTHSKRLDASCQVSKDPLMSLIQDIDQLLVEEGERHLPLVLYLLKRSQPERTFPLDLEEKAKKMRLMTSARNLLYFKELRQILTAFNESGIDAIPLKGVVMDGIYPAGMRSFSDMDILIHRETLPRVLEILRGMGYRPHGPLWRPGAEDFQGELAYVKDGPFPIMVEPHWSLGPPYPYPGRLDMKGLWVRARKAEIAGVGTLILSPEDLLLHACLHLVQHSRGGWLASACDITELIHHYGETLDWAQFVNRVIECRLALPVRFSLEKAAELFRAPVPPDVRERLQSFRPSRFEQWIFTSFTSFGDEDNRDAKTFIAKLMTMKGPVLKLRYTWDMLFPGKEFMASRYPELRSKPGIYSYLYRLTEIAKKGLKILPRLFSRHR